MLSKTIIVFLGLALLTTVTFFLLSEYPSSTKPVATFNTADPQSASSATNTDVATSQSTPLPDKSLPIPAHQLKKLLAKSSLENNDLTQRIAALDQKVQALNKVVPVPPSPNAAPVRVSSDKDLVQRIQRLQEHIDSMKR